jgi:hypothetical protein
MMLGDPPRNTLEGIIAFLRSQPGDGHAEGFAKRFEINGREL